MAKKQQTDTGLPIPTAQGAGNEIVSQQGDDVFGNAGFGASYDFAGKDIDRYLTYGSTTYGKLGYDPFRDNANFYNQNTDASADLQRAWTGMWKLAGVGFKDTFGFGAAASDDAHKEFDQVMSNYGSTRKGTAGFISNTMLSSGYTVGIMGAIAAEELLLAGATALTGGISAPGTIAEMGAVGARGMSALNRGQKAVKGFDKVMDVLDYTKNIQGARTLWAAKQSQSVLKKLAPMGDTFDFLRNADNLKDLNGLQKTLQGTGALARDARKIHMTNAESKLEANLAKDEFREELINQWNADPAHVGMTMDDVVLNEINDKANGVFANTYNGNLALIYATNAITFDVMFKSMRGVNKMFGLHDSLKYTVKKGAKGLSVTALEDTFGNTIKKHISQLTWKGTAKKTLEASVEGFQEIGQDAISGTAKYYAGGSESPGLEGNFWNSFYESLGEMHGESFLSGMLMGTFASPVGRSIQAVNKFTVGGGYQAVTDPNGYAKGKKAKYDEAVQKAEVLEKFFNDSGSYIDYANTPLFSQSLSKEQMTEAGEVADRKTFEDKRTESFRTGLHTMMETGTDGELLDYLDDLGNYTAEELNQAMGRTDITEGNKGDFMGRVENYKTEIKSFKEKYDNINRDFVNPISIQSLASDDPEFLEKKLIYHAHQSFKKEMLFSQDRLDNLAARQKTLYSSMTGDKFTTTALNTILSSTELDKEISSLKEEIKTDKEYNVSAQDVKERQERLEALESFKVSLEKYDKLGVDLESTEAVYDEMFESFNAYHNAILGQSNTPGNRVMNKRKFQEYWDYMNMRGESEVLQEFVNTMTDPTSAVSHIGRIKSRISKQEKNKKQIIEDSLKSFYNKQTSDEMIAALLEESLVFDHSELDDLIDKGIMPRKIYNINTHKEASAEEIKNAQAIIGGHFENLTGKKIVASDKGYATRKKSSNDKRKSSDLINQYSGTTGVSVSTFVSKLKRSKRIGNTEKEILDTLSKTGAFKDVNIIVTDNGEAPLEVSPTGDIIIDVRFSSEDYEGGNISFEYLGVSALMQTYFTDQLDKNPSLKNTITALMEDVKDATLEREGERLNRATINNIPVFNKPAVFLSEALNNSAFQTLLKQVEDTTDVDDKNLWESLREKIVSDLGSKFEGSLLNRAVDLAYLTITDETIEELATADSVTPVPTEPKGDLTPVERTQNNIDSVQSLIKDTKAELNKTKRLNFTKYIRLSNKLSKLEMELADLNQTLLDEKESEVIKEGNPISAGHTKVEDVQGSKDSNGNLVISGATPYLTLPIELQIELAEIYSRNRDVDDSSESGKIKTDNISTGIVANAEFDEDVIGINPEETVDSLTEDDVVNIQTAMQTDIKYIEAIAQYNNRVRTKKVEVDKTVEDEVVEDEAPEYVPISVSDLVSFYPGIKDVMSDVKIQNRVDKLNTLTSQKDISKFMDSIAKEIAVLSTTEEDISEQDKEDLEAKAENWRDNKKILDSRNFKLNGKVFKLPKADIPYFLEQYPRIMWGDPQLMMKAAKEYKENSTAYAKSLVTNPPSIDVKNKSEIQDVVDMLLNSQVMSSRVAGVINNWLRDEKSTYALKRSKKGVAGVSYTVTTRKGSFTKPKSKSQQLEQDLSDWFNRFDGDIFTATQVEFSVYDFLRNNKVHPSSLPINEKRSYTSSTSEFVSVDGIADKIFDNYQQEQIERLGTEARNIVEDILSQFETISELRNYLTDEMVKEQQGEEYGLIPEEELPIDMENLQLQSEMLSEYFKSNAYLIANNGFTGDVNTLTAEEKNLYDLVQAVNQGDKKQIEKHGAKLFKELQSKAIDKNQYDYVKNVGIALKSDPSLKDILAIYSLINHPLNNLTDSQRKMLNSEAVRVLQSPKHIGKVITTGDSVMRIMEPLSLGNMILQRLHDGKVIDMNVYDVASEATAVLESGTEYDPTGFDNMLTEENADDLANVIGGIFDNFTESMNEYSSMNETTLMNSITEELNKCK